MMGRKNTGPVTLTMTLEACFHRKLKKLLNKEKQGHVMGALREAMAECDPSEAEREGWKEAAIAWNVCSSIHQQYAKGKDPFYTTRHTDFLRHHVVARGKAVNWQTADPTAPAPATVVAPAKYRPVPWHDTSIPGTPILGWGIERKGPDESRYKPVLYDGAVHPFLTKKEAQQVADKLMEKSK